MPAWGLIPDSPIFYYGSKSLKTRSSRRSRNSYVARISVEYSFSGVVIYKPILNFELNNPMGMVGKHMHQIGAAILIGARKQVGVDSGALRRSLHMKHRGHPNGQTIEVGSSLKYAYAHHEGTKPHVITPNPPNKVLVFSKGARVIRTTTVNHPGTKPNRYLSDQLRVHVR